MVSSSAARTSNRVQLNAITRLLLILLPGLFFTLYSMQVSTVGSWAKTFATVMGDKPSMWDSVYDAQRNGPLVAFTRQLNPKVMIKPENYSEETMKEVAARYDEGSEEDQREPFREHDRQHGDLRAVRILLRPVSRAGTQSQQGFHAEHP